MKVEFAFLDYEKNGLLIHTEYLAMMGLWVFLTYYGAKALGKVSKLKRREQGNEPESKSMRIQ